MRRQALSRLFTIAAIALAIAALGLLLFRSATSYSGSFLLDNSSQLVRGNLVKVGGARVGTVKSIELTESYQAKVEVEITEDDVAPLHEGTRKGTDIVRMKQNGEVLSSFDPPDTTDSAGQPIGGAPVDVAVSPDGSKVAYSYYQYNCPPGVSCGARYVTLYSSATSATPEATYGKLFRNSPSWVSNNRNLAFGGFLSQVNYDSPGGGTDDDVHWFDDMDMFDPSTDLGDAELSRQGDRIALIRGYGDSTHLIFHKVTENVVSGSPSGPPS